jgi:hypothetical protein
MATPEGTTRPSTTQQFSRSKNNPNSCTYCSRPITKRIIADRKPYCGKICAALGLISAVDKDDEITDVGIDAVLQLVEGVFYEGPTLVPIKVRDQDGERAWGCESFFESVEDGQPILVCISDEGKPDWAPDPVLDADQEDMDYAVEKILAQSSNSGGDEATL